MPLQVAVFDFDLTLSACHLYYSLSGGDGGIQVPPPHAETEKGQLARLLELDASPDFRNQVDLHWSLLAVSPASTSYAGYSMS